MRGEKKQGCAWMETSCGFFIHGHVSYLFRYVLLTAVRTGGGFGLKAIVFIDTLSILCYTQIIKSEVWVTYLIRG